MISRRPLERHNRGRVFPERLAGSLISFSGLSFTRSSVAYEEQVDGSLIQYAIDAPRKDPLGMWHIEASLSEQVRHNRDLSQAVWVKTNCTVGSPAYLAPDGTAATNSQLTATALGDMSVHQVMPNRTGSQANYSVYLRSDNGPHNVLVSLNDGTTDANTTVSVGNIWQRIGVQLRPQAAQPTARVSIIGAAAGARLSVWGGTDQFSGQLRFGHVPSHIANGSGELTRGRDILTGTAAQVPAYMKTKPWGFRWRPGWRITGTDNDQPQTHEDVTFFSFGLITDEVLFVAYDPAAVGQPQLGWIMVRGGPGTPTVVAKATSQTLRAIGDEVIEVRLYPEDGLIWVSGAIEGNGFGPQGTPWTWIDTVTGLQIGDRISQPNTHTLDGWISEPFVIPEL